MTYSKRSKNQTVDNSHRWKIPLAVLAVLLFAYLTRGCSEPTYPDPNDPWPGFVSASRMSLTPVADTYLAIGYYHGAEPGNGTMHNNGLCPTLFVGSLVTKTEQAQCRSLLAFEVPDLCDSAKLKLTCMQASEGSPLVVINIQNVEHDPDSLIDLMGENCCWPPFSPMMNWPYLVYDYDGAGWVAWNSPGCGSSDVSDSLFAHFYCDTLGTYWIDVTSLIDFWIDQQQDYGILRLSPSLIGAGVNIKEFHSMNHLGFPPPEIMVWY